MPRKKRKLRKEALLGSNFVVPTSLLVNSFLEKFRFWSILGLDRESVIRVLGSQYRPSAPRTAGSPLLAYVDSVSNNQVIYYIGTDQDLLLLWWNGDPWRTLDLTATTGGPKASALGPMVAPANSGLFYLGTDGNIYQFRVSGSTSTPGSWHSANISAIAGAPSAMPGAMMFGYIDPTINQQLVYYIGADQHAHLFWWNPDPRRTIDITGLTSAPNVL